MLLISHGSYNFIVPSMPVRLSFFAVFSTNLFSPRAWEAFNKPNKRIQFGAIKRFLASSTEHSVSSAQRLGAIRRLGVLLRTRFSLTTFAGGCRSSGQVHVRRRVGFRVRLSALQSAESVGSFPLPPFSFSIFERLRS